ncbi:MAG: alpha/beta fold hydrolase [Acidimicrobiia bacterium]
MPAANDSTGAIATRALISEPTPEPVRSPAAEPNSARVQPVVTAAMCASGRVLGEPRLSHDGEWVVFVSIDGGRSRLVRMHVDGGPELILTTDPAPARVHPSGGGVVAWLPDSSGVVFVGSDGGLWRIGVNGGPAIELVPATEGLWAPAVSPDGRHVAYSIDQAAVWFVPLDGSRGPSRLAGSADFVIDPVWLDDRTLLWQAWDVPDMPWDRSRIECADITDGNVRPLIDAPDVQCQQPVAHPVAGMALLCDASGWLNVHRVVDDEVRPVAAEAAEHGGPTWGDRQRTLAWSPDGTRIAFCRNELGFGRLCVVEVSTGVVEEVAKAVHLALDWRGDRLVALRTGGKTPTQLVSYDTESWDRTVLARGPAAGFEAAMVEPELLTWTAVDGSVLHARHYVPTGRAGRPNRTICWIHGGPTDQWPVEFNARMVFFLARGWSVLVPDHRGSTGHGRSFTQAMRGRWGELDVSDVISAIDMIRTRELADEVVLMGGSAGGFTVLNVMATLPGLVSAAVVLYPVIDLVGLASSTHRFEAHYCESLIGPLASHAERYRSRSVDANDLYDPLLVLHGDSDRVVPVEQSRSLVARVASLRRSATLIEYPGEGHGWKNPATTIDELCRIEEFLAAHTAGGTR